MSAHSEKAPKKEKEKRQTPEQRLEAMRYNHMMYGLTEGELRMAPKKVDYGASYLKHPKFLALIAAFRKGTAFKFEVTAKSTLFTIATDGSHITFDQKTLFYARALNKHEDNLFLDRAASVQVQTNDAAVHLIFAVLRSFPELGDPALFYQYKKLYLGTESLETGPTGPGSNVLLGHYKHSKPYDKPKA